MKIRPMIKIRPNGSALAGAVTECVKVVQELRALDSPLQRKLTAAAFLKSAMRIANTTEERLRALREKIFDPEKTMYFEIKAFLRRAVVAIQSPNWPGPSRELRRYNFMITPEALAETVALGSSTFEVFALAVLIAIEAHPECFGTCVDLLAHQKRLVDLGMRRDDLYEQIGKTDWGPEEILTSPPDSTHRVLQTFVLSRGAVSVHPKDNAGERLVGWALSNANKPKSAPPPPPAGVQGGVRRVNAPA